MFELLATSFDRINRDFLINERNLILSGVSERCLCGAFMLILNKSLIRGRFRQYYTDIEYNRNFDGQIKTIIDDSYVIVNITCDLIVHSRGLLPIQDNLIAIEMKRTTHPKDEKDKDRTRLRALTKSQNDSQTYSADGRALPQHVCGYILGIFYEINIENRSVNIERYRSGKLFDFYRVDF